MAADDGQPGRRAHDEAVHVALRPAVGGELERGFELRHRRRCGECEPEANAADRSHGVHGISPETKRACAAAAHATTLPRTGRSVKKSYFLGALFGLSRCRVVASRVRKG